MAEESARQLPSAAAHPAPVPVRSKVPMTIHPKVSVERQEEAKLLAKYPQGLKGGGSALLQKRLQKGQKYFDSGEYNMAKSKAGKTRLVFPQHPTGDAIPTPENLPARKVSQTQSRLVVAGMDGAGEGGDTPALVAAAAATSGPQPAH